MKLLPVFIIATFLLYFVPSVSAQSKNNGSITVSPAYIEISLTKAGEEQKIPITFTNNSSETVTLEMFPIDFNHADVNGTIGFLTHPGSYSYALASYLSLEASEITLGPRQSHVFNVLVMNRPDLSPGGHYAAIVGRVHTLERNELGANLAPSLSSLIFLSKTGGERYNLSLNQVDPKETVSFFYPDMMQLQFQNEGNIHLVPYGRAEVKDMFGRVIQQGILNTSSFLVMPESRRNVTVTLRKESFSYPISLNTLTISGNDSLKKTRFLYRNTYLYINPFFLLGIIVVIGGGIVLKRRYLSKKQKVSKNNNKD